jgi:chemotaxis signal transduction protein
MQKSAQGTVSGSATRAAGCWNRIGVRGDASCPELAARIHCRNCPVYSAAAAQLLDAEPPREYLTHWTGQVAIAGVERQRERRSVLVLRIGPEWLALSTAVLLEIAALRAVHAVPQRRDGAVLGLVNIRGELTVCMSLRQVLGLGADGAEDADREQGTYRRLVVLSCSGKKVACPVDEVHGIQRVAVDGIRPAPATVAGADASFTRGVFDWNGRPVGVLDEHLLFQAMNRGLS